MENLQKACITGFLKRASAHGFSEQEASELLKQANPLGALRGFLGQAARGAGQGLRTAVRDVRRSVADHPRTGIAAKQLLNNADKVVPDALEYLNQTWLNRAQRGAANLASRAAKLPQGTMRSDLLHAVSRAAAGVPAGRVLDHMQGSLMGAYGGARRGFIDALKREGINLNAQQFRPPSPRPTPAQDLINRIHLGLGRLGNLGATMG